MSRIVPNIRNPRSSRLSEPDIRAKAQAAGLDPHDVLLFRSRAEYLATIGQVIHCTTLSVILLVVELLRLSFTCPAGIG